MKRALIRKFATTELAESGSIDTSPTANHKRIVYAEVYAPLTPDTEGDYMDAADIERMAHDFMAADKNKQIDLYHDNELVPGACVVESFIAREGDPIYIPGAWVVGVRILNDEVWQLILEGKINGFSVEAWANRVENEVIVDVPDEITGFTSTDEGHSHKFIAVFDEKGSLLGGETDVVDGHSHKIFVTTCTAYATGITAGTHKHNFSSVENIKIVELIEPTEIVAPT